MAQAHGLALLAVLTIAAVCGAANAAALKSPGAGRQYNRDGKIEKCPPGFAKSGPGNFKCKKCSGENAYQDLAGQTQCKKCPTGPGYVVDADHTSCTFYGPGMEPSKSGKPAKCAKGFAKASPGPFRCTACRGTAKLGGQRYSDTLGATACKVCPVGGTVNPQRTSCTPPAPTPAPTPAPFFFNPCLLVSIPDGGDCTACTIGCFPGSACDGGICSPICPLDSLSNGDSCDACPSSCVAGTTCQFNGLTSTCKPPCAPLTLSPGASCSDCPIGCPSLFTCTGGFCHI